MLGLSITLLLLLVMGKYTTPEKTSIDYDTAWDELFGHLTSVASASVAKRPIIGRDKLSGSTAPGKSQSKTTGEADAIDIPMPVPPVPPAKPFVFIPENNKLPSIGANSYGNMEGIAISQNRGISLGIYMVNSSYNSFSTNLL